MTVSPTSYDAKTSDAFVRMLSACTSVQTWLGAANAAAALTKILEDDSGDLVTKYAGDGSSVDLAGNFLVVRLGETRRVDRAWLTWGTEGDATIVLAEVATAGDKAPESMRRARNNAGAIRVEFESKFSGQADYIPAGRITMSETVVCDESGGLNGRLLTILTVAWRDIP